MAKIPAWDPQMPGRDPGLSADRAAVLDAAAACVDSGRLLAELRRRVAYESESQEPGRKAELERYLTEEIESSLDVMGFASFLVDNPVDPGLPMLIARRHENDASPTVLIYGHADVVRGDAGRWHEGLSPWQLTVDGDRWYGRGTADNKGQHTINLAALKTVFDARGGKLGFNAVILMESGEERSSPGLDEICAKYADLLAADVLIASDGPRVAADRPTVFLGSRGIIAVKLSVDLGNGAHHSGNWGGLLRNPATTLAAAINSIVDSHGRIRIGSMRPPPLSAAIRDRLADVAIGGGPDDPSIDDGWGEPGLSPAERVIAWNTFEVLAMESGNVSKPAAAIPSHAIARCHLRYVVGTPVENIAADLQEHFKSLGLACVEVEVRQGTPATRLDPDSPWAQWAIKSIGRSTGRPPAVLPNLGGTIPNHVFAETLGLPTIWVPHSYPACSQHAPNEHLLGSVAREGMQMMAGLFWDLGIAAS